MTATARAGITCAVLTFAAVALAGTQQFGGITFDGSGAIAGDGTGVAGGFLRNLEVNTAVAAGPNVLTAAESGKVFTNEGASAQNYHTLPSAAAGLWFTFHSVDSDGMRITAASGDDIELGGLTSSTAGYISTTTSEATIHLLAENTQTWTTFIMPAGSRSAWDIDGTATGFGSSGCYYFSTPAATSNGVGDTVKAAGTTTAIGTPVAFTHSGSNRLTYNGLATRTFIVTVSVSMTKATGGSTLGAIAISEDGTPVTGALVDRTLANTNDEGAMAVMALVELDTNEYVELFCRSANGDDLTIQSGTVTIVPASVD